MEVKSEFLEVSVSLKDELRFSFIITFSNFLFASVQSLLLKHKPSDDLYNAKAFLWSKQKTWCYSGIISSNIFSIVLIKSKELKKCLVSRLGAAFFFFPICFMVKL